MIPELKDKKMNVESMAEKALEDEKILSELLDNLKIKDETVRYNSSKVLNLISQKNPGVLYPHWDYFVRLLLSDHTYWKLSVIPVIANLTGIDTQNKFKDVFDKYFGLLNDKSMITAVWIAANSGRIAKAKPDLQTRITDTLLRIDETHHDPERIDLIKGGAIESFDEYFEETQDKKKILEFVRKQKECKSPKTRKIALKFLEKWTYE
ncbi:MAG: hypothetical protein PVI11_04740 [Candidatus Aminicenantes bacterium]|jgi:hypothetical protein